MKCDITNNSDMNIDELSPLIDDLASHVQGVMNISSLPAITLQEDADNADVLLGKTAQYDPQNKVITVYVTNRHPKDIMRSISHEMIHHAQNERGEFDNVGAVGEGYAQADKHLRNMEKEAYLKGNMCFRDWEDGYKRQMMESIHRQNSFKRRNNTMKIHKWKNNELNRLLMEKFNFGENTLLEASCSANRDGKEDEECPKCGKKHATHKHDDEDEDREKMEEANCMGQGSRGDKECPECGKKNCPGKDGKEVNEEKKPDENNDGIPDYAQDGKGKNDLGKPGSRKMTAAQKKKSDANRPMSALKKTLKDSGMSDEEIAKLSDDEIDEKAVELRRGTAALGESFREQIRKQLEEILKIN